MATAERSDRAWLAALGATVALSAAAPPAWFVGAEFLVVPGLACLARALRGRGGFVRGYLVGAAYLAAVSWSIGHVLFAAYLALFVVGGLYTAVLAPATRALVSLRVPEALAFALTLTASMWLRAHMVDVPYPHAQHAHALFAHVALLHPASWGGEVAVNFLLALLGAGLATAAAAPRRPRAWGFAGLALAAFALPGLSRAGPTRTVTVVAIQPGLDADAILERDVAERTARAWRVLAEPTLAVAGVGVADPPALVLWPESTSFVDLAFDGERPRLVVSPMLPVRRPLALHRDARLLVGAQTWSDERAGTPIALLLGARGEYLGHQEKQRLAPGGERQPFLGWLPRAWSEAFRAGMSRALGIPTPHLEPGAFRPPLSVAPGLRIGALLCFDNAFDDVIAAQVEEGANLLAVLSNEAWYRRGTELAHMEAMSVFRALETGVPLVRAAMDGATLAVARDGRVVARVPHGGPESLRIALEVPESPGPVAPVARWLAWLALVSFGGGLAHAALAWARLRRRRTRPIGSGTSSNLPVSSA